MIMRHWRLFDELQRFQDDTNRFFEDLQRRLGLLELAMSNWENLDRIIENQRRSAPQRIANQGGYQISSYRETLVYEQPEQAALSQPYREPLPTGSRTELPPVTGEYTAPMVDVYERDGDVLTRVDLPGLRQGDIEAYISGRYLIIRGRVSRTIELPAGVNPDRVRVTYRNGTLEVSVPKESTARKIDIDFQ